MLINIKYLHDIRYTYSFCIALNPGRINLLVITYVISNQEIRKKLKLLIEILYLESMASNHRQIKNQSNMISNNYILSLNLTKYYLSFGRQLTVISRVERHDLGALEERLHC